MGFLSCVVLWSMVWGLCFGVLQLGWMKYRCLNIKNVDPHNFILKTLHKVYVYPKKDILSFHCICRFYLFQINFSFEFFFGIQQHLFELHYGKYFICKIYKFFYNKKYFCESYIYVSFAMKKNEKKKMGKKKKDEKMGRNF